MESEDESISEESSPDSIEGLLKKMRRSRGESPISAAAREVPDELLKTPHISNERTVYNEREPLPTYDRYMSRRQR